MRQITAIAVCLVLSTGLLGDPLRIATWNLKNYLVQDRVMDGRWRPDFPKPEREKRAIRRLIRRVDPDILVLQEMGSPGFLRELLRDLQLAGVRDYRGYVCNRSGSRRNLAIISRIEVVRFICHEHLSFLYYGETRRLLRGVMEAVFDTGGQRWHLYGIHLKSRFSEREEDPQSRRYRLGEWLALREHLMNQRARGELGPFCVVGDFNEPLEASSSLSGAISTAWPRLYQVPARDSAGREFTYTFSRIGERDVVDALFAGRQWLTGIRNEGTVLGTGDADASDHRLVFWDWDPDAVNR